MRRNALNSTNEWFWALAMGRKGQITLPAAGLTAPKLDDCSVFFNSVYHCIYIKNTKTAASCWLAASTQPPPLCSVCPAAAHGLLQPWYPSWYKLTYG